MQHHARYIYSLICPRMFPHDWWPLSVKEMTSMTQIYICIILCGSQDPSLCEPPIWRLSFSRVQSERLDGAATCLEVTLLSVNV